MLVIGEQAEVVIETGRLPAARLVPEDAVHGFDGAFGTVWVIEDGRLRNAKCALPRGWSMHASPSPTDCRPRSPSR